MKGLKIFFRFFFLFVLQLIPTITVVAAFCSFLANDYFRGIGFGAIAICLLVACLVIRVRSNLRELHRESVAVVLSKTIGMFFMHHEFWDGLNKEYVAELEGMFQKIADWLVQKLWIGLLIASIASFIWWCWIAGIVFLASAFLVACYRFYMMYCITYNSGSPE